MNTTASNRQTVLAAYTKFPNTPWHTRHRFPAGWQAEGRPAQGAITAHKLTKIYGRLDARIDTALAALQKFYAPAVGAAPVYVKTLAFLRLETPTRHIATGKRG